MIVEVATGDTIASELQARLFGPLRLRDTSFPTLSEIDGSHTHGYVFLDQGPFDVTPWSPSGLGAAGAILSNADDVARFYRALLDGRLLPRASLKAMQTIDPAATGGLPDAGILGGGWGLGLLNHRHDEPVAVAMREVLAAAYADARGHASGSCPRALRRRQDLCRHRRSASRAGSARFGRLRSQRPAAPASTT